MGQATAPQDSSTPAKDNPPVDVAKAQPSSPDTPPQRVAARKARFLRYWGRGLAHHQRLEGTGVVEAGSGSAGRHDLAAAAGRCQGRGLTPLQLQDLLTADLKKYISDPQVTVIVTQVNSLAFNVVGEVLKPDTIRSPAA